MPWAGGGGLLWPEQSPFTIASSPSLPPKHTHTHIHACRRSSWWMSPSSWLKRAQLYWRVLPRHRIVKQACSPVKGRLEEDRDELPHYYSAKQCLGMRDEDFIYCNFTDQALGNTPYNITLDRHAPGPAWALAGWRGRAPGNSAPGCSRRRSLAPKFSPPNPIVCRDTRTVVLAIRGSSSVEDLLTDLMDRPVPIADWVPGDLRDGRGGEALRDLRAHVGMYSAAKAVLRDLCRHRLLQTLLLGSPRARPGASGAAGEASAAEAAAEEAAYVPDEREREWTRAAYLLMKEREALPPGESGRRGGAWFLGLRLPSLEDGGRGRAGGQGPSRAHSWLEPTRRRTSPVAAGDGRGEAGLAEPRGDPDAAADPELGRGTGAAGLPDSGADPELASDPGPWLLSRADLLRRLARLERRLRRRWRPTERRLTPEDYAALLKARGVDCRGWRLVVTGHSLGAAVAVLVGLRLRRMAPDLRVWAYSSPGGMTTPELSAALEPFVTNVVIGKDLIPRLGTATFERLIDQVRMRAFFERVCVWGGRGCWRGGRLEGREIWAGDRVAPPLTRRRGLAPGGVGQSRARSRAGITRSQPRGSRASPPIVRSRRADMDSPSPPPPPPPQMVVALATTKLSCGCCWRRIRVGCGACPGTPCSASQRTCRRRRSATCWPTSGASARTGTCTCPCTPRAGSCTCAACTTSGGPNSGTRCGWDTAS